MTADDLQRSGVGLCLSCLRHREVPSSRGQLFHLCERSASDPRFRKYPILPVVRCAGYEAVDPDTSHSTTE